MSRKAAKWLENTIVTTNGANNGGSSYTVTVGSSGDTFIDVNGRRINGAPTTPITGGELTSKTYVDTLISSVTVGAGSIKEPLLSSSQLDDTEGVLPAFGVYLPTGTDASSGVTFTLYNDTDGSENFIEGTDWNRAVGDIPTTLTNLATAINTSLVWGAEYCANLTRFNATEGILVVYLKTSANGSDDMRVSHNLGGSSFRVVSFNSTAVGATGSSTSTTYTYENIAGDFLMQNNGADPGADVDYGGLSYTAASLLEPQTHWILNDNVRYTWDADGSQWNLSASNDVVDATAGSNGGTKGILSVDSDFGLTLTGVNNALRIVLESTNPSLSFSSGELGVKINGAGGLEKNASGLGVNTDATGGTTTVNGSNELAVNLRSGSGLLASTGLGIRLDATTNTSSGLQIDITNGLSVKAATNGGLSYAAADAGLQVLAGDGITLDADGVNLDFATSSGLELTTTGGTGQARINVDATGGTTTINGSNELAVNTATNGGLEASSGLKVQDGDGIALDANGTKVDVHAVSGLELSAADGSGQLRINLDATTGTTTINGSNELVAHYERRAVEEITLTGTDITNEFAATSLTNTPVTLTAVKLTPYTAAGFMGPDQRYGVDFTVVTDGSNNRRITWTDAGGAGNPTVGLVSELEAGDILIVEYSYFA